MKKTIFYNGSVCLEEHSALLKPIKTTAREQGEIAASLEHLSTDHATINGMIDAIVSLENLHQKLHGMKGREGLSKPVAQAIDSCIQHVQQQYHLPERKVITIEHFTSNRVARMKATEIAAEALSDTIRDVVKRVVAWVRKAMTVAVAHIQSFLVGASHFTREAKSLEEKALKIKAKYGNSALNVDLKDDLLNLYFGDCSSAEEVYDRYMSYNSDINEHFCSVILGGALDTIHQITQNVLRNDKASEYSNQHAAETSDRAIALLKQHAFSKFARAGDDFSYELPFGAQTLMVNITEGGGKSVGMHVLLDKDKNPSTHPVRVLTPTDVMGLAKGIDMSCRKGVFRDHAKIVQTLKGMSESIVQCCGKIESQQSETQGSVVASLHFLQMIAKAFMDLTMIIYRYTIQVNRTIARYCHQSLNAYSHSKA